MLEEFKDGFRKFAGTNLHFSPLFHFLSFSSFSTASLLESNQERMGEGKID